MTMLQRLKSLDLDRIDVDEAIALATFAGLLVEGHVMRGLEAPEWLLDSKNLLEKEIKARHRDKLEKDLKETEAALETLKTAAEKREDLKAKAERLKAALG